MQTETPAATTQKRSPGGGRPRSATRWQTLGLLMQREGLDDASLAERMGVTPRAVGGWRRGERVPDESGLDALCVALNASPEESRQLRADAPLKKFRRRYADSVIITQPV